MSFSDAPFASVPFSTTGRGLQLVVPLTAVTAVGQLGTVAVPVDTVLSIQGVDATIIIEDVIVENGVTISAEAVPATITAGDITVIARASISVDDVSATITLSDAVEVTTDVNLTPTAVSATATLDTITISITNFDFNAIRDAYDRNRVVYIEQALNQLTRTYKVRA
jgi:hypothetical protein